MRNFQRKRGWRNILESWPVLGFFGILLLVFILGIIGFMEKMRETSRNRVIAENKVRELQQEKTKLSFDIAELKTDAGIEESIRLKFGLAKEGEGLIVVVDDKNPPAEQNNFSEGFWSFLKNWFK